MSSSARLGNRGLHHSLPCVFVFCWYAERMNGMQLAAPVRATQSVACSAADALAPTSSWHRASPNKNMFDMGDFLCSSLLFVSVAVTEQCALFSVRGVA